ncbi:MAG: hypothetical protein ACRCS6_00835, partial [Turicibacter sp.]
MIMWLVETLQKYPELALFLTLAIGFALGNIRIGSFKLGSVTGVLLTGVLIGQLNIVIDETIKSVFFLLFLFTLGYNVGPQFFKGLKKEGISQVIFTLMVCATGLITTLVVGKIFGYHMGQAAGLGAGALTQSSMIGVSQDFIAAVDIEPTTLKYLIDAVPVGYAVTYIFGTVGSALVLSTIAPKMLKSNLIKECREIEIKQIQNLEQDEMAHKNKSIETDMVFVGIGIAIGILIGIPCVKIGGIALSLSTSGGALLMGLIFGYIHSKRPNIGYIPKETAWFLQNVGLAMFIAVVGINAGPSFIAGIKASGLGLIITGMIVTLVPIVV